MLGPVRSEITPKVTEPDAPSAPADPHATTVDAASANTTAARTPRSFMVLLDAQISGRQPVSFDQSLPFLDSSSPRPGTSFRCSTDRAGGGLHGCGHRARILCHFPE